MPHKAKLIPPDGTVSEILLPDDDAERLAHLQKLVGGLLLDVKPLTNGFAMVSLLADADDLQKLPVNDFATSLAFRAHAIYSDEDICGTVVIVQEHLV